MDSDDDLMVIEDLVGGVTGKELDWLKVFEPKEIKDVALHPKKLEDLRNWFKIPCAKVPNKILLLEGPNGCSKTISLKLVAKECGYEVVEWINTTDLETDLLYENKNNFQRDFVSYENQVSKFTDFILRTSRFQSLLSSKRRLLLVKDLPNTFLKKTEEFWNLLRLYGSEGMSPLVFVLTETNSNTLNIGFNLFPDNIRLELDIDTITFNAISKTLMTRGIKRILQMIEANRDFKVAFLTPSETIIDSIVDQSQGDIRNAVLNLNFASQQTKFKVAAPKTVKTKKVAKKVKSKVNLKAGLGKNESLSMMHGLGRALYPKLEMNEETKWMELTHNPEDLAECFSSQPANFLNMLNSNYLKNFTDIHALSEAADIFSLADCFQSEYRDDQLCCVTLNLVVRSTMVLNKSPASGFRPITSNASKKWKQTEVKSKEKFISSSKVLNNGNMMGKHDFYCDYKNLLNVINGSS